VTAISTKPLPKGWQSNPWNEYRIRLAKWYAAQHGISAQGTNGGWLYDAAGRTVAQGWLGLYFKLRLRIIEEAWGSAVEERAAQQDRIAAKRLQWGGSRVSPIGR
jgi:hypothetical protein